jgi:DNA-directed RNA polymerase subunit RPC12/RpoP
MDVVCSHCGIIFGEEKEEIKRGKIFVCPECDSSLYILDIMNHTKKKNKKVAATMSFELHPDSMSANGAYEDMADEDEFDEFDAE